MPSDDVSSLLENIGMITPAQAWHYRIVPHKKEGEQLFFLGEETNCLPAIAEELEMLFGKSVSLLPAPVPVIEQLLNTHYRRESVPDKKPPASTMNTGDFLPTLIQDAKLLGSSDIHIETYDATCRIRFRIDGMLLERYTVPKEEYASLINKIKIQANIDIAEKRLPQDGRIFFNNQNKIKFDIRVSTLPTLHGEKIVLRLLNNDATNIDLFKLGFSNKDMEHFLEGVRRPNGIVLISGPTGSGKTTTLYATLKLLNKETRNITTIEDPIEYTLEGVNQVQLKESIGLTFASALRTFLRQDPDVIMLGEIRDVETATIAIRAALTGHLVLSTIHTNSAWGTLSRLTDMGVPPYLLASTLNTSVAQRLVRLLCSRCKTEAPFTNDLHPRGFKPPLPVTHHYLPKGCEYCHYTGYKGRKAVYEVIPINDELVEHIKGNGTGLPATLAEIGVKSLAENAFILFSEGLTSAEDMYPLLYAY